MIKTDRLHEIIDAIRDDIVAHAVNLVMFPTVSGREKEAQEYVRDVLTRLGFDHIDMWEPDIEELKKHEAFISPRNDLKGSPNVVGTLKGSGGGRSLILNSHIDIVPEGDPKEWRYPPFGGRVDDGVLYGRGASDMKATKAAFFGAVQALQQAGIKLKGDLTIQSVIEEESGSSGTLACAIKGYRADAAIIPEPSGFKLFPAQQGSSWFRIHVKGKSAHAGQRYMGVNAIEKSTLVIKAIGDYEVHINDKYTTSLYEGVPIPFAVNIGNIKGGDWPSTVPDSVVIEGRMGVPPGLALKDAWEMFETWIEKETGRDDWLAENRPEIEWFGAYWGPSRIDPEHEIVKTAAKAYANVMGGPPTIAGSPWGTDARMLNEFAQTPALVFGPGTSAHCPDEFIKIDDLIQYVKILTEIIVDWCGVE